MPRRGGVTTKTLLATALFAALAATSVATQAQTTSVSYFDYGAKTGLGGLNLPESAAEYTYDNAGTVGLLFTGLSSPVTMTGFNFAVDDSAAETNALVTLPKGTTNYSVLVVDSEVKATAMTEALTLTVSSLANVPKGLESFTGLTITAGNSLAAGSTKATQVSLIATGLDLFAMNIQSGATYTGSGADQYTASSTNADATAQTIAGTEIIGTSLTNTATATATEDTTAGLNAYGAVITGKLQDISDTTSVSLKATVTYDALAKPLKGEGLTANAAGANIVGGTLSLATEATGNTIEISGTITNDADHNYQGVANAYGINATSDATVTIGATGATKAIKITGTVDDTNGTTGVANAYGIYASGGSTVTINSGSSEGSQIQAQIGSVTGLAVAQLAAGLYATGAIVNITGGESNAITISGSNSSTLATEAPIGTSSVYGIYAADDTTLNLAGMVSLGATAGAATEGYTADALYASNSYTTITGKTSTTAGNVVFEDGGTLTIGAADSTAEASLTVGSTGNFSSTDLTSIDLIGGAGTGASAGDAKIVVSGGNATIESTALTLTGGAGGQSKGGTASIGVTGNVEITGGSVQLTGGAAGGSANGGDAQITATGNTITITNVEIFNIEGGNGVESGKTGGAASVSAGTLNITGSKINLVGGANATSSAGGLASLTATAALNLGNQNGTDDSQITVGNNASALREIAGKQLR